MLDCDSFRNAEIIRPFSVGIKMENIILSKRLSLVADFVRKGAVLCDVGTDHAYLPAYLMKKGEITYAIAADLREGPLKNAKKTVKEHDLENKIELRLSDGLENVHENEVTDIVLAGMGGDLICDILSKAEWLKNSDKRIIAQPQTHSEKVRHFFMTNGFKIIEENAVKEDDRLYICVCAECTKEKSDYPFGYEYYGELPKCENVHANEYLLRQRERFLKRADGLSKSGQNETEAEFLYKLCETLKDITEGKTW